MNNQEEWKTVSSRRSMQRNKTQDLNKFNRLHAQKRVSILEQVSNGALEPNKAEQLLRPGYYRSIPRSIYYRTTKSGAVAVYGFSTRPLVLYEDRWYKFFEWIKTGELENYLRKNSKELRKPSIVRTEDADVEADAEADADADVEADADDEVDL